MSMANTSSSDSSRPCGENCEWSYNDALGDWEAVHGCADDTKWCDKPASFVGDGALYNYTCTDCYSSEQLVSLAQAAGNSDFPTHRFGVVIRKLGYPEIVGRFTEVVEPRGTGQIYSSAFGWMIKVRNRQSEQTQKASSPLRFPSLDIQSHDNPLSVGLVLPEASEYRQLWVDVTPDRAWSEVRTAEWDVLVVSLRREI